MPKRYILSSIYFLRALSIAAFIMLPVTTLSCLVFGAVTGLLWLSTVPPTSALVAVMFGTRWLAMLFGFAFFSHQVGGFLGVLIGGIAFERTGSYDIVWWLSVLFGVLSAVINLPIVEKPVVRARIEAGITLRGFDDGQSNCRASRLADAAGGDDLRLPDRDHRIRAAVFARPVPDANVVPAWLGARSVRARARDPDADVGRRTAFRGCDR